jgi:hypothetical protein
MNCIACAGPNTTQLNDGTIAPFVIARAELVNPDPRSCVCHDCGMRWCTHRLSETEATKLYADYRGPTYNAAREHHEPGYTAAHAHLLGTVVEAGIHPFSAGEVRESCVLVTGTSACRGANYAVPAADLVGGDDDVAGGAGSARRRSEL